jgi:hypothetical protein
MPIEKKKKKKSELVDLIDYFGLKFGNIPTNTDLTNSQPYNPYPWVYC